tara:strand:- start:1370 stop:1540 length:171 start_codon:yes stop_codon:yes gene_type:complete
MSWVFSLFECSVDQLYSCSDGQVLKILRKRWGKYKWKRPRICTGVSGFETKRQKGH